MKRFTCALLTVCTILTASSSALAGKEDKDYGGKGDTGNVQTNVQTGFITGDDNGVLQKNQQMNQIRGRRGNNVNVQDNDQLCDVAGNVNACAQESRQESRVRGSRTRRSVGDDD